MNRVLPDLIGVAFIALLLVTIGRDAWQNFRAGRQLERARSESSASWLPQLVAPDDRPWPRRFTSEHGVEFETRDPVEHRAVLETLLDIDVLAEFERGAA